MLVKTKTNQISSWVRGQVFSRGWQLIWMCVFLHMSEHKMCVSVLVKCEVAWEIHFSCQQAIRHMVIFQGQVIHCARSSDWFMWPGCAVVTKHRRTHTHTLVDILSSVMVLTILSQNYDDYQYRHTRSPSLCTQNFKTAFDLSHFYWAGWRIGWPEGGSVALWSNGRAEVEEISDEEIVTL